MDLGVLVPGGRRIIIFKLPAPHAPEKGEQEQDGYGKADNQQDNDYTHDDSFNL
jgi:hypothetical protein